MVDAVISGRDPELGRKLLALLRAQGRAAYVTTVGELHPADVAMALRPLEPDERYELLEAQRSEMVSRLLEELDPELREEYTDRADDDRLVRVLASGKVDDAVFILDRLDEDRVEDLLSRMDERLTGLLTEQVELEDDRAGHMMQRDVMILRGFNSVGHALAKIRARREPYDGSFFVLDARSRLIGVAGMRDLIMAAPEATIGRIMTPEPIQVRLVDDRQVVIDLMQRYHLRSIPVVDDDDNLRGMITWDDAVDAMEAEDNEDILALAGSSEDLQDNAGVFKRSFQRLPFLLVTAVGGFVMARLIHGHSGPEDNLFKLPILLAFLPLVPALGGNIGIQCSTVTVRSIATGELSADLILSRTIREIGTGSFLALILAGVCGLGAATMILLSDGGQGHAGLPLIISIALLLAISVAACFGVLIPLACTRMRIDPAIAAGPFITTLNDITGVAIYLTTAGLLLKWMPIT